MEEFVDIKKDICNVLDEYKIQSQACGATKLPTVPVEESSTISKILKIIWWFILAIVIIFIIIIVIFVIKAKQKREEDEENN